MKKYAPAVCGLWALLFAAIVSRAMLITDDKGRWPADWPKVLEPLRDHARTLRVASGTQENVYEITFSDQAEFEKAWPVLLSLKTPGAPLRLYKVGKLPEWGLGQCESNAGPIVRIYGPPESAAMGPNGQRLKASAPWAKELYGPHGELPEFVRDELKDGKLHWVPRDPVKDKDTGFHNRARIDVDLVIDGHIIDLNRVALPADTSIEDHRF